MKKLITALALVASASAQAEFYSGNDLHNFLTSDKTADRMLAIGFVAGVFDVYVDVVICTPSTVTLGQVNDVVKQYLIANPQRRHMSGQALIREVMSAAYPCNNRGRNL